MIIGQTIAQATGIRFIAKSTLTYAISTSQNVNVPSCIDDDMLIAVVMHRYTITAPAGWTLVDTVTAVASGSPTGDHRLSIYSKDCSGDSGASTTWTQSSSARIAVLISAYRKIGSTCSIVDFANTHADNSSTSPFSTAVATADADDEMGIAFASYALANSDALVTAMALTMTGSVQDTPANVPMNRLCGGHVALDNGGTTTGSISTDSPSAGGGWVAISLVLG